MNITVDSVMEMVTDQILQTAPDQDTVDYNRIESSFGDLSKISATTLRDLINELQGEIDSRPNPDNVECNVCGSTDLEVLGLMYADDYWYCNKCQDDAEREVVYTKWDCEENDIMNERGVTE